METRESARAARLFGGALGKTHTPATRGTPDQPSPLVTVSGRPAAETTMAGPSPGTPAAAPAPPAAAVPEAERKAAGQLRILADGIVAGKVAGSQIAARLREIIGMLAEQPEQPE